MGLPVRLISGIVVVGALICTSAAPAATYDVSVDTSSLGASSFSLAFDFIDGGTPSNNVSVSAFSSDGTLGAASPSGGVAGSLPAGFTLTDAAFFNEYLQVVSSVSHLAFTFDATSNAPDAGSVPDTFSFFLLDNQSGLPLFDTTDPTGAGSLFTLQIDGSSSGVLSIYSPVGTAPAANWTVTAVPEPSTVWLLAIGMGAMLSVLQRRKA
jgi:PEP-CTERM motif